MQEREGEGGAGFPYGSTRRLPTPELVRALVGEAHGLSQVAGRQLPLNEEVYASASEISLRNRGIARLQSCNRESRCRLWRAALAALLLPTMLVACQPEADVGAREPRPGRTVTVEKRAAGGPIPLTGRCGAPDAVPRGGRIA